VAPPAPVGDGFANVEPVNVNDLEALWKTLLDKMAAHGPAFHSLLCGGTFAGIEDGQAVIRYSKKNAIYRSLLERNGKKDLVRDGLSELLGKPTGVRFEVDETSADEEPARPVASAPVPRQSARAAAAPTPEPPAPAGPPAIRITPELIEQLRQDPLVGSVMDKFNAVPVKIE